MTKIKDFKNRMIKATLALTMIVGTNSLLFTNVYAEGNEGGTTDNSGDTSTTTSTYHQIVTSSPTIDYDFEFENAVNSTDTVDPAVFVTIDSEGNETTGNNANGNKTQTVSTTSPVTIKFPNGFKYYNGTVYDLYITITPENDKYSSTTGNVINWTASRGSKDKTKDGVTKTYKYITVEPGTLANTSFNYSMWLQTAGSSNISAKVTTINFVAGSCYTHKTEGARPWGDTDTIYYNGSKDTLELTTPNTSNTDIVAQYWAPTTTEDNYPDIYILGHGTDNGTVNGGYVRTDQGHGEMLYGYIVNTNSFVVNGTTTEQVTPEGSALVVPDTSANVPTGSYISGWKANKDVVVKKDDTTTETITAGNTITPEQLETIIPTEDVTYTATVTKYTTGVAQSDTTSTSNPYDKFVVKKGDSDTTGVASATISATNATYDGTAKNGTPTYSGFDSNDQKNGVKDILPNATINETYYVKGASDTAPVEANKTTNANSGATTEGGAPVNVGTYYVQATINSGVDGIAAQTIYTTYEITPTAASTTVEGKTTDYTGNSIELVTESTTVGGTVWYKVGENGTWTTDKPKATDAGTYTIYYYVKGDANHTDDGSETNPKSVTTTINKVRADLTTAKGTTNEYDGTEKELVTDAKVKGGTIYYKVGDNGTWSTETPKATEVGEYKIYYYVEGDANHYGNPSREVPGHVDSKIIPIAASTTVTGIGRTYDGTTKALVTESNTTGGTVYYSLDGKTYSTSIPEVSEAGKYTVYYYVEGDENHSDYGTTDEPKKVEVEVKKAASSTEVKSNNFTYDGTSKKVVTAFNTVGGTVYYSLDGKTYSEGIPQLKDAGTYTIYYYVKGDANHSDYGSADKPYSVQVKITEQKTANTSDSSNTLFYGLVGVTSVMVAGVLLVLRRKMVR